MLIGQPMERAVELALELRQMGREHRQHIRVRHGGGNSVVLAVLGQDVGGDRHLRIPVDAADDRCDATLVFGIRVRVQEPDGEDGYPGVGELTDALDDLRLVQRRLDGAGCQDPLADLARVRKVRERLSLRHVQPTDQRTRGLRPGKVEDLPEAGGREQPHARPGPS